jgi:predicted enzyme related to lactoylglutathione lyase
VFEIEICIDVPDLARGVRFYTDAFGFSVSSQPYPGVAKLTADAAKITLLERREQSKPSPNAQDVRHYMRHWTPVHLDFHVEDVRAAMEKATLAGATVEQVFDSADFGPAAFCADPFGNGFCLLRRAGR